MLDRPLRFVARPGGLVWLAAPGLCGLILLGFAAGEAHDVRGSELRRNAIVKAVERVRASVVNIHGEKTIASEDARPGQPETIRRVNGMGTGVVIDERGYIVTNHHVVDGVPKINVTLADETTYVARLVSFDSKTDLALIKIDCGRKLPVIPIGTSSDLMPGESVIAVGNAFGYRHTVTNGIISELHRDVQVSDTQSYEDLIQTNADINPGNSGGPLLNIDGDIIGINVAVRAGAQGIGFAIPIDKVLTIATDMLSSRRKTWHGVVASATAVESNAGIVVGEVADASPGAEGGLKSGDVITAVGEVSIARPLDLERALLERRVGDEVEVSVERDHQSMKLSLVLSALPEDQRSSVDEPWQLLGLRLEPVPTKQFAQYGSRYRGGLTVTEVRPDGPGARQGIRRGDILVGMHHWETVKLDDVSYILSRPDFARLEPLKFYILRGKDTLYGHLAVSHRRTQDK